jgi:formyl-CoA transferase
MAQWHQEQTAFMRSGLARAQGSVTTTARSNDIVVPLEGAGGKLTSTISSPIQVHGVTKVPARRAPALGEHNEEILKQLGFSTSEIEDLRASGVTPAAKERAA